MALSDLKEHISILSKEAKDVFTGIRNLEDLNAFSVRFLGTKSDLNGILACLKNLSDKERKIIGPEVQGFRSYFLEKVKEKKEKLEIEALNKELKSDWIDVTKSIPFQKGALHPLSLVQNRVEEIFMSMGFEIADGPEVETEWNNFDALNIPMSHPARDMQDTFWVRSGLDDPNKNLVLRTQTSNVQIRKMKEKGCPIRLIAPGRVFRAEAVDASHDAAFYQVEGLLVDENISLAHLKGTMEIFLTEFFERKEKVRLRPGYFPFVEPGLEVDFLCAICGGKGCKTCKYSGWVEFMGAGMVHPNVLRNCNIDPEKYSGFAFGFGLTRLVMMKYGIDDIRLLSSQKKEFLEQF